MAERRYEEEEIAEIFETAATTPEPGRRGAAGGLTLSELQSIGKEVGVAPERIAQAAAAIDRRRSLAPRRTALGMPISVGRTIELPRGLTDREWDLVVADLRSTFHAQGREESRGDLRSWRNGNLHVHIEPTESGHRLRMATLKGDAMGYNTLGAGMMAMAVIMMVVFLVGGEPAGELIGPLIIGAMGAAGIAFNAVRVSRWSLERQEQMDTIAERVQRLVSAPPEPGPTS